MSNTTQTIESETDDSKYVPFQWGKAERESCQGKTLESLFSLAERAYHGTSFSPEKRAAGVIVFGLGEVAEPKS